MPYRVTYIFQVTTAPTNREAASPHSGGWSESYWCDDPPIINGASLNGTATERAKLLPSQVDIVGYRVAAYSLDSYGNKLVPGGTSTFRKRFPGNTVYGDVDLPQCGLMLGFSVVGQPTAGRITLRGIPDNQITFGEYQPTPQFKAALTNFCNYMVGGGNPWGSMVRDKINYPPVRVLSITPVAPPSTLHTLVVSNPGPGSAGFIRLRRVRDDSGKPVSGSFFTAGAGASPWSLQGLPYPTTVSRPNGTAYYEALTFAAFSSLNPSRAVVRKIGSPPEKYRGRRSKRRA
jgi:hypothetical protein